MMPVVGGEAEEVKRRFAAGDGKVESLVDTLKNCVSALAGSDRTLAVEDLEVGILENRGSRRTFERLSDDYVRELLA